MRHVWRVVGFAVLGVVIVALSNFFRDAGPIETRAREAACAGRGPRCSAQLARLARTPFWSDLQLRVGRETVSVRCTRSAYLFGEIVCTRR